MDELEQIYSSYAALIGAPTSLAVLRVTPSDSGAAHVERVGTELHYVVTERGQELERRRTNEPDVLLYWLLSDVTHEMASAFAAKNKRFDADFRTTLWSKQLQLLGLIKEEWRIKRETEINSYRQP